jgi:hypothetical protein
MITAILDLAPTTRVPYVAAVAAVIWTLLFVKLYREQQRRKGQEKEDR